MTTPSQPCAAAGPRGDSIFPQKVGYCAALLTKWPIRSLVLGNRPSLAEWGVYRAFNSRSAAPVTPHSGLEPRATRFRSCRTEATRLSWAYKTLGESRSPNQASTVKSSYWSPDRFASSEGMGASFDSPVRLCSSWSPGGLRKYRGRESRFAAA